MPSPTLPWRTFLVASFFPVPIASVVAQCAVVWGFGVGGLKRRGLANYFFQEVGKVPCG